MIAIVGGGIAGTAIAKTLNEKEVPFLWVKNDKPSASHISSGIINPTSGRRFSLAWNYEKLRAHAISFYQEFIKPIELEKHFQPFKEGVLLKDLLEGKEEYVSTRDKEWVDVHQSFQVNVSEFLKFYSQKFAVNTLNEKFNHALLENQNNNWTYKNYTFSKVIFAEGIFVKENPFFNYLDFRPNRGEALILNVENFKLDKVRKYKKFICNYRGKFWVGSSFDNIDYGDPLTTDKVRNSLEESLPFLIPKHSYNVIEHIGAIRSTTYDRKPIIGEHPEQKNLFLFNGFGTKGCSLVPYCSKMLVENILNSKLIEKELSIERIKDN